MINKSKSVRLVGVGEQSEKKQPINLNIEQYESFKPSTQENLSKSIFNPREKKPIKLKKSNGRQSLQNSHKKLNSKIKYPGLKKLLEKSQNKQQQQYKKQKQDRFISKKKQKQICLSTAKQFLNGKTSVIWIFVVKSSITQEQKKRIHQMYNRGSKVSIVPLCTNADQMGSFIGIPNSFLKIASDLESFSQTQKKSQLDKVLQYHIFNDQKEKGISSAVEFKSLNSKVKGIYVSLDKIIDKAQDDMQKQVQLQYKAGGIQLKTNLKIFPSFMKLSNQDKSIATMYRANIYEGINLPQMDREFYYREFIDFVRSKYREQPEQLQNLKNYQNLKHFQKQFTEQFAVSVIKFYTVQSFYYKILNLMLKTLKNPTQFGLCMFPLYQTYNSIRLLYRKLLNNNKRIVNKQTLYRGTIMRSKDFLKLQPGAFIQTFGFMSTSKSKDIAKGFCQKDSYLLQIQVPLRHVLEKYDIFDHGFLNVSQYSEYKDEQQVLFNPLNVFKVTKITKQDQINVIHLQYGAMLDLMGKQRNSLNQQQKDVLVNYEYCCNTLQEIKDHGDVLYISGQFQHAIEYYQGKVKLQEQKQNKQSKYYYKLANVQQKCGKLKEADQNLRKALEIEEEKQNLSIEKCLKVFSIHQRHASVNFESEDYIAAETSISNAIDCLAEFEQNNIKKAQQLRSRGTIKFKKGEVTQAEKDFKEGEKVLINIYSKVLKQRQQLEKVSCFQSLIYYLSAEKRNQRQTKINQVNQKISRIRQQKQQIDSQVFRLNNSCKQIYKYVENSVEYQKCVKKGKAYVQQIQKLHEKQSPTPEQKAEILFIKATVQDFQKLATQQKLLEQAIQIMKQVEPFHIKVGQYSQILANKQKTQLNKFSNPKSLMESKLDKNGPKIIYNKQQRQEIYKKCKINYQTAIVIAVYNEFSPPKILGIRNQYAQMEYFQANYQQSYQILRQGQKSLGAIKHTQLARSYILRYKINIARGETKMAFMNLKSAQQIARTAIVKKQQQNYEIIFDSSDIMIEIRMQMSKLYMKQLNHEESLRLIGKIQSSIKKKVNNQNHSILADISEIKAENYLFKEKFSEFKNQFKRAISIRTKQFGKYSPANGITCCKYSRYLSLLSQFSQADNYLNEAVQIMSCFEEEHPLTWQLQFSKGTFKQKSQKYDEAVESYRRSIGKILKQFDKSHIMVSKLKLLHLKNLQKIRTVKQEQIKCILKQIKDELRASIQRNYEMQQIQDVKNSKVYVKLINNNQQSKQAPQLQIAQSQKQSCDQEQEDNDDYNKENSSNESEKEIERVLDEKDDQKIYIQKQLRNSLLKIKKKGIKDSLNVISTNAPNDNQMESSNNILQVSG